MCPRPLLLLAALACASPLAAQGIAHGPRLLRVVASSDGVVLSLDSATIARSGDSTFVLDAVTFSIVDDGRPDPMGPARGSNGPTLPQRPR